MKYKDKIVPCVREFAEKYRMFENVKNIIAGVSGGADSMCMLHLLEELQEVYGYRLVVVHIHHGIRGKEAEEDMEYVENYCSIHNIPFYGYRFAVKELAKQWHLSEEEAGRRVRYQSFEEVRQMLGGGKIAVAHNRDDVSETFLFHLFRGSGLRGIAGIPPVRDEIIRPVLCLSRKRILEYLEMHGIEYKTDKTNLTDTYTRNKIRNQILPYVEREINAQASEHIWHTANMLKEMDEYMKEQEEKAYERTVKKEEDLVIRAALLLEYPKLIQKMVLRHCIEDVAGRLKDVTQVHVEMLQTLLTADTGKRINLPYRIQAENVYGQIHMSRKTEEKHSEESCTPVHLEVKEPDGSCMLQQSGERLEWKWKQAIPAFEKNEEKIYTKSFDYDILGCDFQVRTRRSGDYIVINRQGGRKKIKDYFIDRKVPKEERKRILLLARGNEVFWIIGYRISERCKITESTKTAVEITFFPK